MFCNKNYYKRPYSEKSLMLSSAVFLDKGFATLSKDSTKPSW